MKIIFMGSPEFAVPTLAALHESASHEVVAVYAQPPKPAGRGKALRPCPVHAFAEENGIPAYTPKSLKSEEVQAEFAAHGADVAVVAAYGLLLPQPILDTPRHGCINVHPSALPRWRGAAPLHRTILAGDAQTAMCIMQMEAGLDTGDVLWHEEVEIPPHWDTGALHDHMAPLGAKGMLDTLTLIENGAVSPQKQNEDGVTYAHKIDKAEAKIDWTRPAAEILNQIRGLSPYPAAYFEHGGEKIKIYAAEIDKEAQATLPAGTLSTENGLTMVCGDGQALRLLQLQRPGKKRMDVADFMKGWRV